MKITRRLFSRGAVVAPVVAPQALHSMAANGAPYNPLHALSVVGPYHIPQDEGNSAGQKLRRSIWNAIRKIDTSHSERFEWDDYSRRLMGGLDPDLYSLNSIPYNRRVQMQTWRDRKRQEHRKTLRYRLIKTMGGDPEDFHD